MGKCHGLVRCLAALAEVQALSAFLVLHAEPQSCARAGERRTVAFHFNGAMLATMYLCYGRHGETCFGWRGILIEPNPANFAALRASGRRATLVHSGACSTAGTIRMSVSGGAMAANVDHMSRRHRSMHRH